MKHLRLSLILAVLVLSLTGVCSTTTTHYDKNDNRTGTYHEYFFLNNEICYKYKDKILKRFKTAYKELNEVTKYNYVVINDEVELASKKVEAIIESEKCRVDRIEDIYLDNQEEMIHEILMDKEFVNENTSIN